MRNFPIFKVLLGLLLLSAWLAPGATAGTPSTFEQAQALAAERGTPVLVDFFTDWCVYCKKFDKDSKVDASIQSSLGEVVLFKIDAEKGDGIELAKRYEVSGYPNYVLVNVDGEVLTRWSGYGGPDHFTTALDAGVADPTTVAQKMERFDAHPTLTDAKTLATIAEGKSDYASAVKYYTAARELTDDDDYGFEIFQASIYGSEVRGGSFTLEQIKSAADLVMASKHTEPHEMVSVVQLTSWIGKKAEQTEMHLPYLKQAFAATADSDDEKIAAMHGKLAIEHALFIEKDGGRAVELKWASMPEGWQNEAEALNGYAWWAFENSVDLERAEKLARKGVDLADAGGPRAMILDTLAEICNALGECHDAVSIMERAIAEDPDNDYYKEQLDRFQKLLQEAG